MIQSRTSSTPPRPIAVLAGLKRALALLAVSWLLSMALAGGAQARERIVNFDSEIWVHPDSTMTVRETINVIAEGQSINRSGHYSPRWYSGRGFDGNFGTFASDLGSGFSGAIAAASTAPGLSSGSGGGGGGW